jgi:hypothetical protein
LPGSPAGGLQRLGGKATSKRAGKVRLTLRLTKAGKRRLASSRQGLG